MTGPDTGRLPVLLALTGEAYEEAFLAALERPGSRLVVARRCLDLADLLAVSTTGVAAVAVVDGGLHRLDGDAVARLSAAGVAVVAVRSGEHLSAEPDLRRLEGIGVCAVVDLPRRPDGGADGPTLLAATTSAVLASVQAPVRPEGFSVPAGPLAGPSRSPAEPDPPRGAGRLVAVGGPVGAPGRTSVAVGLAEEAALLGRSVLLADADTYGPSLAQVLGVLDEVSGLAAAVRAANSGDPDGSGLAAAARTLPGLPPGLRVLTGLTRADRWPELRPAALSAVWRQSRRSADLTVVDCGFCLEEDEELAYDTLAPRRNAAAVVTLAAADLVVAVGSADPVGLARLVRGLHDLGTGRGRVRVVLTRVRPGPVGRGPGRRLAETLSRHAGVDDVVLVPDDRVAYDRALARGVSLAAAAPRSPARRAIAALAQEIAGGAA